MPQTTHLMRVLRWCYLGKPTLLQRGERAGKSREEQGPTLPITLDPQDSADFLDALLRTKEAWLEVSYRDGRKEVRRWDASLMSTSSNVIGNLTSRPEFRNGTWQQNGIASVRVSVEHPKSKDA